MRGVAEVGGEAFGVDGGGGDDDLEVGAAREKLPEVAEDEVDVQAALVRLVDDQRVVAEQVAVAGDLVEEDPVGHQLDEGAVAGFVGEADLVADDLAEVGAELFGDPLGDGAGCDPPGLGVPDLAGDAAPDFEADLGELGGLPGSGLAGDDHDLVVAYRFGEVVFALADRELFGVGDLRERGAAPCDPLRGAGDVIGELRDRLVLGGLIAQAAGPVDTPIEPVLVGQHQLGQYAAQVSERGQRRYLVHRRERVDDRTRVVPTLFRA